MAEPIADTAAVCTTSVCFYFSFRKLRRSMEDEAVEFRQAGERERIKL